MFIHYTHTPHTLYSYYILYTTHTHTLACEIAVALSKYAGEPDALTLFDEFATGYGQTAVLTVIVLYT